MYDEIPPHPNSKHGLTEYLSKRGESKLESFHDRLTHFANSGMRNSLADNLCLAGTARWNLNIRHKRGLISLAVNQRKAIPAAWEKTVAFYNHSELWYVNWLADAVKVTPPFPNAEILPKDNGERFFSEYLTSWLRGPTPKRVGLLGQCLCALCCAPTATTLPVVANNANEVTTTISPVDQGHQITDLAVNNNPIQADTPTIAQNSSPHPNLVAQRTNQNQVPIAHNTTFQALAPRHILLQQHFPLYFTAALPTPPCCCAKYSHWLKRRVGRPPHDNCCPTKYA
jgi:hypothetical protein